jgi:hypothetical protein
MLLVPMSLVFRRLPFLWSSAAAEDKFTRLLAESSRASNMGLEALERLEWTLIYE